MLHAGLANPTCLQSFRILSVTRAEFKEEKGEDEKSLENRHFPRICSYMIVWSVVYFESCEGGKSQLNGHGP